jgi:diguanylate cyclase (GGDEF)-like protein
LAADDDNFLFQAPEIPPIICLNHCSRSRRKMPHRTRYSLRTSLLMVVAACIVPVALICGALIYTQYQMHREQLDQTTLLTACKVVADLERELASIESGLKVLATSPELAHGNLARFHGNARRAIASGIAYNYILTDANGAQLLNTLRPFGSALPRSGTPAELAEVFSQRSTRLTGLFRGPVTGSYAIAMGVPVVVDDVVRYSLNIGLAPAEINRLLADQPLPEGWLIAVLDQHGTIIGRSRDAERFTGQRPVSEVYDVTRTQNQGKLMAATKEGIPVVTSFCTSERWQWQVVTGAPVTVLHEKLKSTLIKVLTATALIIVLGISLALGLARRILSTVRDLNQAAAKLADGERVDLPKTLLKEADAVGNAIVQAGVLMEKVKFLAQHDALTGLANRRLFEELAAHQLDLTRRQQTQFAVIAIDLDGFKEVNDQLGHHMGDHVLRTVAERLTATIRSSDIAARIGGDEFLVLLCDTETTPALETAWRMVSALAAPYPEVNLPLSASLGLAFFPQHGDGLPALMQAADQALYRAKAHGKARVEVADAAPDD